MSLPPAAPPALGRQDVEQLRWLTVFYYVTTGLLALMGCFPIIHLTIGAFLVFAPDKAARGGDPAFVGWLFIAIAVVIMVVLWSLAALQFAAARAIDRRRRHTFCVVVAAVTAAMCIPFGTALGVFTLIVLMRPQVKAAFGPRA